MRIDCPYCGPRDSREFSYLGDAGAAHSDIAEALTAGEVQRVYLRDNPAGPHLGLWYHDAGCRSWLSISRDTRTHEIFSVSLVQTDETT